MGTTCAVWLLGRFRVDVDGRAVPDRAWRHRRAAALVKLLALAPDHRLHREQLIEQLWPDLAPDPAGSNLRKAVFYVRRAMEAEEAIELEGGMVALWPEGEVTTDVERFQASADAALDAGDAGVCAAAAADYTGELLPEDTYEPWSQEARERLRRRHLQLVKGAGLWERVLELDPADEEAHRGLMRSYTDAGDRHAAMRQFERMRTALHDELGVGPDPRSVSLYEEILAMEGEEPPTPAERARSLLAQALVAWNRMDVKEAQRAADEARTAAVEAGLGRELGEASALLGMAAHAQGRWRELFREEFEATISETPNLAEYVFDAHLCLAEFSLYGTDSCFDATPFAEELLSVAEAAGSLHGRGLATLMLGEAALLTGHLEAAESQLSQAAELHAAAGADAGRALCVERLAEAILAAGRRSSANRLLRDALELADSSSLPAHLVVRVHGTIVKAAADHDDSVAAARAAEEVLSREEVCEPCSMGFLVASAIAHARVGDTASGRRQLEHAERVAGMWQGGPWLAAVWEARGELRLAEGEPSQAAALFREAGELFAREGRSLDEARCLTAASAG